MLRMLYRKFRGRDPEVGPLLTQRGAEIETATNGTLLTNGQPPSHQPENGLFTDPRRTVKKTDPLSTGSS